MKQKNVIKRICSFVMVLILALNMSMVTLAREYADTRYYPRKYQEAINYVADNGYMIGTSDTTFVPEGCVTRAMLVTVLHQMAKTLAESTNTTMIYSEKVPFTDVKPTDWFYDAVRWAYANDMVAGNGSGKFSPHDYIIKQDAVLILYKYALKSPVRVYISGMMYKYADSADVSSYALDAVRWAVTSSIFPTESDSLLKPKGKLTRAQMALLVTEYGLNVEHMIFGRDNYGFTNSAKYFMGPDYYITDTMYDKLKRNIFLYYGTGSVVAQGVIERVDEYKNYDWYGSCYGMSVTSILDKTGKIDINGNYVTDEKTMHIKNKTKGDILESAINYYHIAQRIPFLRNSVRYVWGDDLYKQIPQAIKDCMDTNGLILFSYWWNDINGDDYGHTVVAYDISPKGNNVYELKAYDCRGTVPITIKMTVAGEKSTCIVYGQDTIENAKYIEVVTDFSAFNHIDIDANMNERPTYSSDNVADEVLSDVLTVKLTTDFVITNDAGEQFIYKDGKRSGNMKIYNAYASTEGPDIPSTLDLYVEPSSTFVFEPISTQNNITLGISNEVGSAFLNGVNIDMVEINADNRMVLTGNNIEYEVIYENNDTEEIEIVTSSVE